MVRLTRRNLQTLRLILALRVATASQVATALYPLSERTRAQANLQKLYDAKMVDRLPRGRVNDQYIYLFTRNSTAGNAILKEYYGEEYWRKQMTKIGSISHSLAINDVRVMVMRCCHESGWKLAVWQTEHQLAERFKPLGFVPDAYWQIEREVDGQRKQSGFFLEAQVTSRVVGSKLSNYQHLFRSGTFNRLFQIRGMRALFVYAPTDEAIAKLRVQQALEQAQELGVSLAHFTTLQNIKAQSPANWLSQPIWRSCNSNESVALFSNSGLP